MKRFAVVMLLSWIGMVAGGEQLTTVATATGGRLRVRPRAQQRRRKPAREQLFSESGRALKQQGMRQALEARRQRRPNFVVPGIMLCDDRIRHRIPMTSVKIAAICRSTSAGERLASITRKRCGSRRARSR